MPKIDFYILPESNLAASLPLICRIIEKAYKQKHRIYIHTGNQETAHLLDETLWTYRDDSFLPHNLYGEGPDPAPPIQIGFGVTPEKQRDILINLDQQIPPFHTQFNRVLEFVLQETATQEAGRERYRYYRTQGFQLNTHKLQTTEV